MRRVVCTAILVAAAGPALAANVLGKFGDWTLYSNEGASKLCFVATPPSATEPTGLKRDPALLYISAWPTDGVKAEVSVKLGFPIKKASEPVVAVTGGSVGAGGASFKLFIKDDRAFVADATAELKMLEAMKKGAKLTVQSVSERGTAITDTFSLSGITAALQGLGSGCG
jgi:hypothetical protein